MEPKLILWAFALCTIVLFVILGALAYAIYAVFSIGARSEPEPKEEYYLIITKSKHRRVRKDENTKQ